MFSVLALMIALPSTAGASPAALSLPTLAMPSAGPARVIGGSGGACIAGAVMLPLEGPGYQAVDLERRRYFGHPQLVAFIEDLGRVVAQRQLGTLLVGDMAQARGGPMAFGHVSHQGGLDVDLWYRLDVAALPRSAREGIAQPSVVLPATGRPDPLRWTARHAALIQSVALDARVARVFVGAAIKRDLCQQSWPDRSWLRRVRTWPGHDDHLHVRLLCPPASPDCRDQPALPQSEGCSAAELASALAHEKSWRGRPAPRPNRVLPPACEAVLTAAN
jgi:penicillin-insensitive murein DD-endopeptidase